MNLDDPRPRIVTPRTRGYSHRSIIVVRATVAVTETGEYLDDPARFAASHDGHVWIVDDPAWLLHCMIDAHGDNPDFNYQIITSEDDAPVRMVKSRITRFGFRCQHEKGTPERDACPYRKRRAMHTVWSPSDLSPNPGKILTDYTGPSMLELARDIRDWCKQENIPLPGSLVGIANSLLRDKRFWPEARGRVPRATNERVRRFLPGVYNELHAAPGRRHNAVSLDQRTAYHIAVQQIPMPDPTSLFARGYFHEPEKSPVWTTPGKPVYERIIRQPGIVYVLASVRPRRKHEVRPPAVAAAGQYRVALWTNEIPLCEANGIHIEGIIAAWTSTTIDTGMPLYGAYAQRQITEASEYRQRWLKPTLHALYGLLAVRPRRLKVGHLRGKSKRGIARIGFGHEFNVSQADLGVIQPLTANTAALGVLQAEIRKRSFALARDLSETGVKILHIHADGIHVEGSLPFIPDGWKIEPLTDLEYLDKQSWLAREGDCLPGRDIRKRVEMAKHRGRIIHESPKHEWRTPESWNYVHTDVTPEDCEPLYWPDGTKRAYVTYETATRSANSDIGGPADRA